MCAGPFRELPPLDKSAFKREALVDLNDQQLVEISRPFDVNRFGLLFRRARLSTSTKSSNRTIARSSA
jgi:hypothetical protein